MHSQWIWPLHVNDATAPLPGLPLRKSEIGIWEYDVARNELQWGNDWCAAVDLDPCTGVGNCARWDTAMHPEDVGHFLAGHRDLLDGRIDLHETEYRMRTLSGGWHWVLSRGRVTQRDAAGAALRVAGITVDIDARKRTELALRESDSRLEAAVWGTDIGLWERKVGGSFRWFDNWCARHHIDPCEGSDSLKRWHDNIHPRDVELYAHTKDDACRGLIENYVFEYRMLTREGGWRWLHERGKVTSRHPDGRAREFVGVCFDIDARKQMEIALRDSEARLETAIWGSDLGLWDWNLETDEFVWLSDWPKRYGIEAGERDAKPRTWLARISPLDRGRYEEDYQMLIDGACNAHESDYRILSSARQWRWVNVRTRVIARDSSGRAQRMAGACIEVDARRRAEQTLQTQALILDTMREGVVLFDRHGGIEYTNPAFNQMFGRAAGELTGTSVMDLLNDGRRVQTNAPSVARLLKRFDARSGRRHVIFRRRDGTQFAGEVLSGEVHLSGETRSLVVIQDVSERKHLEREIIEIANRERRRQGSDLHDGLGQELTGISLMLRSLTTRLGAAAAEVAPELDEIIGMVNHAIHSARTMARGLSPVTRQNGGLEAALNALAGWARENYRVDVRLKLTTPAPLDVDEATATHLYLIAQEAINNAVKHGRARVVNVTLRTNKSIISLAVADDGIGIADNPVRTAGMGLKIMEYRAGMIGGSLQITQQRHGGTRVRCVCPQAPGRAQ